MGRAPMYVVNTYNNMANVYYKQGQHEQDVIEYQNNLDIKRQVVGHGARD